MIGLLWWAAFATPQAIAFEACNGRDDDGDGSVDEGPVVVSQDEDGDGAGGDSNLSLLTDCSAIPEGSVSDASDCDDEDPSRHPGADERCDARDDDCDGLLDEGACPGAMATEDGQVWMVEVSSPSTWLNAEASCESYGWTLATPDDPAQQGALERQLQPYEDRFWLGLSDREDEDEWVWVDGSNVDYTNWAEDEPNDDDGEDCVAMDEDGDWNDLDCGQLHAYVCERPCTARLWYLDADGDGLGDPANVMEACAPGASSVANAADCDDSDPMQPALWYLDADGDGYGSGASVGCHPPGTAALSGDCDDGDAKRHPGAEEHPGDRVDMDCDGLLPSSEPEPDAPDEPDVLDTDGDGIPDARDPSPQDAGGVTGPLPPTPEPGCTCATGAPGGWAALLAAGLLASRRRGRQRFTM